MIQTSQRRVLGEVRIMDQLWDSVSWLCVWYRSPGNLRSSFAPHVANHGSTQGSSDSAAT
jgi:hypothetical protein